MNLIIDQLCEAKTLYHAKLDPDLLAQVNNRCPCLLKEPKE
jgi:hypothetical protein